MLSTNTYMEDRRPKIRIKFPVASQRLQRKDPKSHILEMEQRQGRQMNKFFASLNEMRNHRINTDVILKGHSEDFSVHQLVLSAGSSYFRKMFESDFNEATTKTVDFSYVKDKILSTIIEYLYIPSGINFDEFDIDQLLEIHRLSHMFELIELSEIFWDKIIKEINIENCLKVFRIITVYNLSDKIKFVVGFIGMNLKVIVEQQCFVDLNMDDMKILLKGFNEKLFIEDFFLEALVKWAKINYVSSNLFSECFFYLKFDLISRECINDLENEIILKENNILKTFIEFHLKPKLKSLNEIKASKKRRETFFTPATVMLPLRIFCFGLYTQKGAEKAKNALRVITLENNICTEQVIIIPIFLGEGIAYDQCGSHFFFVGGDLDPGYVSTDSCFIYDWKANTISWETNLNERVRYSEVYDLRERIYVIGGTEKDNDSSSTLNIQYFIKSRKEWFSISMEKNSEFRILSFIVVKNVLYLICERKLSEHYCIYKIDHTYVYHSHLPLYVEYAFQFKLVTEYNDCILMFYCKDDQWYCLNYNPENKICENILIDAPVSVKFLLCKRTENNGILFYSDENDIYQLDYEKRKIKKLMKVKIKQNKGEKFEIIKDSYGHEKITLSDF